MNATPYLTAEDATAYTRKPSVAAFRQWARRQGLPTYRMGRSVRFSPRDIDAAMRPVVVKLRKVS